MRPISPSTTKRSVRHQEYDATLYASLELSQAMWLVTVTVAEQREDVEVLDPWR